MGSIDDLLVHMDTIEGRIPPGDPRRLFHATYARTTRAVRDEIHAGGFADGMWVERWDVTFAGMYLGAFEAWDSGGHPPAPWQVAFDATTGPHLPPLRHVLLGMNAHINLDLPQALVAVITDEEFDDPDAVAGRAADHHHIDDILAARVAAEDDELKRQELPGDRTWKDRLLAPFLHQSTRRFLKEAREKVWNNARRLSEARRSGPDALAGAVARLEELSRQRVADLTRPGDVIFELARNGFGVSLD